MNLRHLAACAVLLSLGLVPTLTAQAPVRPTTGKPVIFPLAHVKPGQQATAWTVFEGSEPEAVPVEIIGVWRNAWGPKRTNVAGGMSGSPVYIDGKLVGAVALRLSFFSPDSICGITPIENMLEINELDNSKPATRAGLPVPGDVASMLNATGVAANTSMLLQPIDTPLTLSGANPEVFQYFGGIFRQMGFQLVQGGSSAAINPSKLAPDWKQSLAPGQMVAPVLIAGDIDLSSGCTVTYNDGEKVLVCGHSFLNLGPLNMPMAKSEVLWTLASSFQPNKIANASDVVGAFRQDRHLGLMGKLGDMPRMIPVKVTVRSLAESGAALRSKELNFHVMEQQKFTPQLMMLGLFNAVSGMNEFADNTTYRLSGNVQLANGQQLNLQTMLAPSEAPIPPTLQLAGWWADKFNKLFGNAVDTPDLKKVEAVVDLIPERRTAAIESAWLPAAEVEPGAAITVKAFLRPYRGGRIEKNITLKVPAGLAPGNYRVLLADANTLNSMQSLAPLANRFMDLPQTVSLLNQERANNRLYAALVQQRPTIYADDKTLPSLPSSVLNVMQNGRSTSRSFISAPETAVAEESVPFDYVVSGSYSLRLTVK
jgi:hypothetical protein